MFSSNASQVSTAANYIEDVFSTYLYTGTGASQTITNGIDLSGKGGLVWLKGRSGATDHALYDTARGATFDIASNTTAAQTTQATGLTSFGSTGFTIGALAKINTSSATYVSWAFREQAKFFDVVTYTGNGANRTIAHNLGSVPGCIMIKRTDTTGAWAVYHQNLSNTQYMVLNTTAAAATGTTYWNSTTPTSSVFSLGTATDVNASGGTYVAYLFAHDAGGFGAAGSDNVISCGSFVPGGTPGGAGNPTTVTLGYEPQFVLIKDATTADNWFIIDNMRGWALSGNQELKANLSNAESNRTLGYPTATGFVATTNFTAGDTYIYIAIRRGPMKTPTSGTSVFSPIASSATIGTALNTGFPVDMQINNILTNAYPNNYFSTTDRLRGVSTTSTGGGTRLQTFLTAAEASSTDYTLFWNNSGFQAQNLNSGLSKIFWNFGRAPGFFDIVCYTGTGANLTVNHNLGVAPELIISKARSTTSDWGVYLKLIGDNSGQGLILNGSSALGTYNPPITTATATTFQARAANFGVNGTTYVSYLFATLTGVSKVGSYTGSGAAQTINCGFTSGARFVLIKRTDLTGNWYAWDSARGITSGSDPYVLLDSANAEVTGTDYINTDSTGFQITASAISAINGSGGSFIFLAIA